MGLPDDVTRARLGEVAAANPNDDNDLQQRGQYRTRWSVGSNLAPNVDVYSYTMVRKQIYIDEELDEGLKVLSAKTGEPEAAHVRAALRGYLDAHRASVEGADPLYELIGLVDDAHGPSDVAEEHDHYLYGAPKRHDR